MSTNLSTSVLSPNEEIAMLKKRVAELEAALKEISGEFYPCQRCDETGIEPETENNACDRCGGYGFNPGGDIRQAIIDARNILKGGAS